MGSRTAAVPAQPADQPYLSADPQTSPPPHPDSVPAVDNSRVELAHLGTCSLSLTGGNQWPIWAYRMVFGSYLVFAAVFTALAAYGIVKMCRQKRWNFFGTATVIALLISVFNIFYWELGYFWML